MGVFRIAAVVYRAVGLTDTYRLFGSVSHVFDSLRLVDDNTRANYRAGFICGKTNGVRVLSACGGVRRYVRKTSLQVRRKSDRFPLLERILEDAYCNRLYDGDFCRRACVHFQPGVVYRGNNYPQSAVVFLSQMRQHSGILQCAQPSVFLQACGYRRYGQIQQTPCKKTA